MRRVAVCILCMVLAVLLISACARPTRLEKDYGRSVKQARLSQILDPEAERNLEPVTGLDGKAAQAGIEKYRRTFEQSCEAPPSPVQTGAQLSKVEK